MQILLLRTHKKYHTIRSQRTQETGEFLEGTSMITEHTNAFDVPDDKHYYMYLSLDDETREEIDALIEDRWNRQYAEDISRGTEGDDVADDYE